MTKPDVIIILGGGTSNTLKPLFYTKERLGFFSKYIDQFHNIPIVVSGNYAITAKKRPKYSEAEVMRHYLIKNGVNPTSILLENKSRDTIGNAYYSKLIIKKHPSWKRVLVVTTNGHEKRSLWLFKKILGPKYTISFLKVPTKIISQKEAPLRKKYENYLITAYKKVLTHCRPGDDQTIIRTLKKFHPAFSQSKDAKQLESEILSRKQEILGYIRLSDKK
jgi:uncharacterized SAM-binding protein YcdF (DUF218 family)